MFPRRDQNNLIFTSEHFLSLVFFWIGFSFRFSDFHEHAFVFLTALYQNMLWSTKLLHYNYA